MKEQHEYQDRHWIVGKIKELEKKFLHPQEDNSKVIEGLSQEINWLKEEVNSLNNKVALLEDSLKNTEVVEMVELEDNEPL